MDNHDTMAAAGMAIVMGVMVSSVAFAECVHPKIPWKFGHSTSSTWQTDGSPCKSSNNRPQHIEQIVIETKPQNGIAGRDGPYGVAYKPNAGFKGSDSFTYVVKSNSAYRKGAGRIARIFVSVTVR